MERGTFCTKFALAGFGLSGFRSFSKKWTDRCEPEEKKGHCKSREFFFKRKKRRLKNTDEKPVNYSQLFSQEKRRLNRKEFCFIFGTVARIIFMELNECVFIGPHENAHFGSLG